MPRESGSLVEEIPQISSILPEIVNVQAWAFFVGVKSTAFAKVSMDLTTLPRLIEVVIAVILVLGIVNPIILGNGR